MMAETLLDAAVFNAAADDAPAVVFYGSGGRETVVSREAFREKTRHAAATLAGLGLQAQDLVIIAEGQTPAAIYAFWGALRLGAMPALLPPLTPKLDPFRYDESMAVLIRTSGARLLLAEATLAERLAGVVDCPVQPVALRELAGPDWQPGPSPRPEAIAFLQHSSGTTGLQKGVALTHEAVIDQLFTLRKALALNPGDVVVSWLPLYHDMGLIAGFLLPLVTGIPLVLLDPFDWVAHPAALLRAISDWQGTLCWLPNFAYNHLARRTRQRDVTGVSLASMRAFINCSEPVRADSHQAFLERFRSFGLQPEMLGASYAMAENTFAVSQTLLGKPARTVWANARVLDEDGRFEAVPAGDQHGRPLVSSGLPLENTAVNVLDNQGRPLPERSVGQFALHGTSLFSGYYERPDLEPFQDGWYLTGDTGFVLDGELFVIGRLKDLIINGGKNIYPHDIEALLESIPGIQPGRAVVFGVPDDREGTELIAVVAESATENKDERREIARLIRQAISGGSMVTASYVDVVAPGWLIKTSSGKLARNANRLKWRELTKKYG